MLYDHLHLFFQVTILFDPVTLFPDVLNDSPESSQRNDDVSERRNQIKDQLRSLLPLSILRLPFPHYTLLCLGWRVQQVPGDLRRCLMNGVRDLRVLLRARGGLEGLGFLVCHG